MAHTELTLRPRFARTGVVGHDTFDRLNRWRSLLIALEIRRHIVRIADIREAGERHVIALHLGLGIMQIVPQVRHVPDEIGALHGGGIAEILQRAGLAPCHALEAGPLGVGRLAMAGDASDEELLATRRIRAPGRRYQKPRAGYRFANGAQSITHAPMAPDS